MSSALFIWVDAATCPHLVVVPGEEVNGTITHEWGLVVGDPHETAVVIHGKRDAVLAAVDAMRDELLGYWTAEHENGYHLRAPEESCPECAPEEMACPVCSNTLGNAWTSYSRQHQRLNRSLPEDSVACGACRHEWNAFTREPV